MPYRSKSDSAKKKEAPQTGFVADIVRQFADPYALYRELVQNAIDAGSQSVDVTIFRGADGISRSAITDSGQGMSLDVLQNNLLTLFSSTKEGDESKVGKYGVGFVSVLAIEPEEVVVETWRDGAAHRLTLLSDHSYEIESLEARSGSGTTVALLKKATAEEHAAHCSASLSALRRWCRHAHVPIRVTTGDFGGNAEDEHERIDVPLGVNCAVSVRLEEAGSVFVVGTGRGREGEGSEQATGFAGFYKCGLTLYEARADDFEGLGHVSFKVESPKLAHTLSRDNVRRDGNFADVLNRLRKIAKGPLRQKLLNEMAEESRQVAAGGEPGRLVALQAAALAYQPAFDKEQMHFPLADPVGGMRSMTAEQLDSQTPWRKPLLLSRSTDGMTRAISGGGHPVVLAAAPEIADALAGLFNPRALLSPRACRDVRSEYVFVQEMPPTDQTQHDAAMCQAMASLLQSAGRTVARVALAHTIGAAGQRVGLLLEQGRERLIPVAQLPKATVSFGAQRELFLNLSHHAVKTARRKARSAPRAVGMLLGLGSGLMDHLLASVRRNSSECTTPRAPSPCCVRLRASKLANSVRCSRPIATCSRRCRRCIPASRRRRSASTRSGRRSNNGALWRATWTSRSWRRMSLAHFRAPNAPRSHGRATAAGGR